MIQFIDPNQLQLQDRYRTAYSHVYIDLMSEPANSNIPKMHMKRGITIVRSNCRAPGYGKFMPGWKTFGTLISGDDEKGYSKLGERGKPFPGSGTSRSHPARWAPDQDHQCHWRAAV